MVCGDILSSRFYPDIEAESKPKCSSWFPVILVAALMVTFVNLGCLDEGNDDDWVPTIELVKDFLQGGHSYGIRVNSTSDDLGLESYWYKLVDEKGIVRQFDEIALKNISGRWHGVDVTWDEDGAFDANPGNDKADRAESAGGRYQDAKEAQVRIKEVQEGFQDYSTNQRSEGAISVSFTDYDWNGNLSAGDVFRIKTNSEYHDADENWTLIILYHQNDGKAGSFIMDMPESPYPFVVLDSTKDSNDNYRLYIIKASPQIRLEDYQYYLKDGSGITKQFGEVALQNLSGKWHGIDATWDDDGTADTNQGNDKADRGNDAGGAYNDTTQAQIRIDAVQAGSQETVDYQKSEGTISVSFIDNDYDGKLTAGDQFLVRGNSDTHTANDDYRLELKYDITGDTVASVRLNE